VQTLWYNDGVTSHEEGTMESNRSGVGQTPPPDDQAKVITSKGDPRIPGDAPDKRAVTPEERAAKRTQFIIIAAAIGFLLILVVAIVLMAANPGATEVIRDIAIVFVAVETFLIGLAMILLIFQIQVLIQVLRDEIQPLLRSVNDTASTVRGTTEFVSHSMVTPIIKASGFLAGMRRVLSDAVAVSRRASQRDVTRVSTSSTQGGNKDVEP
jgi:hypothetical protein